MHEARGVRLRSRADAAIVVIVQDKAADIAVAMHEQARDAEHELALMRKLLAALSSVGDSVCDRIGELQRSIETNKSGPS